MPVAGKPIAEQLGSFAINSDTETALDSVERALKSRPGALEIERHQGLLEANLGSQSLFRIWGAWGPGRHQFPTRFVATANADGPRIDVVLQEDAGWYAFSNKPAERLYRAQFDEISKAIRDELNGKGSVPAKGRPGHPSRESSRALSAAGIAMIIAFAGGLITIGILLLH